MKEADPTSGLRMCIMRHGGRVAQLASHLMADSFTRRLERVFGEQTWNGHRSCLLLSFDVDFPEDVDALPSIAQRLEKAGIRASFAVVGRWVQDYPDAHRSVVASGHELVNHSYSHPELVNAPGRFVSRREDLNDQRWESLSLQQRADEIQRGQAAVKQTLGVEMKGFRAPHFGNVDPQPLYPILAEMGLQYSTSMLAPRGRLLGFPVMEGPVVEIPVTTCPAHPLSSMDTWHGLYAHGGWHRDDFGPMLAKRLTIAADSGGITNIYLDPKDVAQIDLEPVFSTISELGDDCWVTNYSDFATWFRTEVGP